MISELARAKINLTLKVLGRRPDGYHEIESLVAFADFGDLLTLDVTRPDSVEVAGPFAASIEGANLLETERSRLEATGVPLRVGHVRLEKLLPVAAGLGGGSSDAAAMLRAVRRANPELAARVDWHAIAAGLGADVPVCLADRAAVMRGVGETLEAVPGLPPLQVVLVNPLTSVPRRKTAMVFAVLGAPPLGPERGGCAASVERIATRKGLLETMRRTGNDLTAAAAEVMPDIVAVLAALDKSKDVELAQLSGAGPTCFGVYPSQASADSAALQIAERHPHWWVRAAAIS